MTEDEWTAQWHALETRFVALRQRDAYIDELRQAWHIEWAVLYEAWEGHKAQGVALGLVPGDQE